MASNIDGSDVRKWAMVFALMRILRSMQPNQKENKEAGTISFEVRIPWKNPENSYGKMMKVMLENGLWSLLS